MLPTAHGETRLRVDFIFSTTPYQRQAINRAVPVELAGVAVAFASAEALVLHKLFAARPRDLEDARGVVVRKGAALDWGYVKRWALEFSVVPGREDLLELVRALEAEAGE